MLGTLRRYAWGVFAIFEHSYTPASENNRCRVNAEKNLRSVDPFVRAPVTASALWSELSPFPFVFPKVHIVPTCIPCSPLHDFSAWLSLPLILANANPNERQSASRTRPIPQTLPIRGIFARRCGGTEILQSKTKKRKKRGTMMHVQRRFEYTFKYHTRCR